MSHQRASPADPTGSSIASLNGFATLRRADHDVTCPTGGAVPECTAGLRPGGVLIGVRATKSDCAGSGALPDHSPRLIHVAFISVYLSNACSDLSRPLPDCL